MIDFERLEGFGDGWTDRLETIERTKEWTLEVVESLLRMPIGVSIFLAMKYIYIYIFIFEIILQYNSKVYSEHYPMIDVLFLRIEF